MKVPNTYFTALLSGRWDLKRSKINGSIFIDRDPTVFTYIINYLRDYTADPGPRLAMLSSHKARLLKLDFEFFMIPSLMEYVS